MTRLDPPDLARLNPALGIDGPLVHAPYFLRGVDIAEAVLDRNEIVIFGGPAGTGKTTTARYLATRLRRPCATVTVSDRPKQLDLLRLIHAAVTGREHHGTGYFIRNDLTRVLPDWGGVLIADEMQNCGVAGYKELVHLYEATERAFALVMVGSEVIDSVKQYPQLDTRIAGTVRFDALHGAELHAVLTELDPRLAATPAHVLARHDDTTCNGLLRRWAKTITWLNILKIPDGPLGASVLADVSALMRGAA